MISSYCVLTMVYVDAFSEADAENLIRQLMLSLDEEDDPQPVYSSTAIVTGFDIAEVASEGKSQMYDADFLPLP